MYHITIKKNHSRLTIKLAFVKSIQKGCLIIIPSKYTSDIYTSQLFYSRPTRSGECNFYVGRNPDSGRYNTQYECTYNTQYECDRILTN